MPKASRDIDLTRKIIIRLPVLLRHVQLVEVNVLVVQYQWALNFLKVLIEPVNGPDHEVGAIYLRLDIHLKKALNQYGLRQCRLGLLHHRPQGESRHPKCR